MAEQDQSEEKTEEPTAKRIEKHGRMAKSLAHKSFQWRR